MMVIPEMEQIIEKRFFFFRIIGFELGVANSRNLEHDIYHRQYMC